MLLLPTQVIPRHLCGICFQVSLGERPQQGVLMWRNSRRVAYMHNVERIGGSTWLQQRARTSTWHRHLTGA